MTRRILGLVVCCSLLAFAADKPNKSAAAADKMWQDLADGNARFVSGKSNARNLTADRAKWAKTQNPHVAVLACADSRVGPELLFDKTVGDLFVVRNAGNTPEPIAIGSLEYSVEVLGAKMIVIMGHSSCGAVKAACSGDKMPSENLTAVVTPIKAACSKAKGKDMEPATKEHVHMSAEELLAKSPLLKKRVAEGKISIVEAYYSLDTGKVERLK